jgi:general secretion pathway protein J
MRNQGFTLLEVLLATTVLGVVMAMLSLALSATLRVVEATEKQEEVYSLAQTAMRRITEDLAAAVATPDTPFIGRKNALRDRRADSLEFASQARLVMNPEKQQPGVALIRYRLQAEADDERRWKLLRADTLVLPGVDTTKGSSNDEATEPAFLLADGLRAVQFRYFNHDGQEFDSWQEEQRSDGEEKAEKLPAAVHCSLEFWIDPDKELSQVFNTRVLLPAEAKDER